MSKTAFEKFRLFYEFNITTKDERKKLKMVVKDRS